MGSMGMADAVQRQCAARRLSNDVLERLRSATGSNVYLSGPMTGIPGWNQDAFDHAADALVGRGRKVFNPASLFDGDKSQARQVYMRTDIAHLLEATDVVLLPGWSDSRGALLEVAVAQELGLRVWNSDGEKPPPIRAWGPAALLRQVDAGGTVTISTTHLPPGTLYEVPRSGPETSPDQAGETCLEEAQRLVYGDRGAAYGHPAEDYGATGAMFGALLHRWAKDSAAHEGDSPLPVPARLACLLMVAVKASRESRVPKRDNRTDLAGYAECLQRIAEAGA